MEIRHRHLNLGRFAAAIVIALFLSLLTLTTPPSAQANPAITSLIFVDVDDPYAELIAHHDPTNHTFYLTVNQALTSGRFELEVPPNTFHVDQTFTAACTTSGLNQTTSNDYSSFTFDLVSSKFQSGCQPNPTSLVSEATFTLKLYDLDEWTNMALSPTLYATYTIRIIAQSNADYENFYLNLLEEDGSFSQIDSGIIARRSWQVMPSGSIVSRSNYIFMGWAEYDWQTNQPTGVTFEAGEVFKLNRNYFVKPVWVLDEPFGTIHINSEAYLLADGSEDYIALDNLTPGTFSFIVNATGNYEISLVHAYTNNNRGADPSAVSARYSSGDISRTFSASSTALNYDATCFGNPALLRDCNLLTVVIEVDSPSGNSTSASFMNIMLRSAGDGEYCATFSDLEGHNSGSTRTQCTISQGWIELPGEDEPSFETFDGNGFLFDERPFGAPSYYAQTFAIAGPEVGIGIGTYYPLFSSTEFVTTWFEDYWTLPESIHIFGNELRPVICDADDPGSPESQQREVCVELLDVSGSAVATYSPEYDVHYLTLDFEAEPNISSSEAVYLVDVDMGGVSRQYMSLSGYCGTELCHQANEEDGTPTVLIPQSEMCLITCSDTIYELVVGMGTYTGNDYREIRLNFFDAAPNDTNDYWVLFDTNGAESGATLFAISGTKSWANVPSTEDLLKTGYMATAWGADPLGTYGTFRRKIPISSNRTIYAYWKPANKVDFFKFESDANPYASFRVEQDWPYLFEQVFSYELTDPTTAGRNFLGWSLTPTNQQEIDVYNHEFTQSTNVYAMWSALPANNQNSSWQNGSNSGAGQSPSQVEAKPEEKSNSSPPKTSIGIERNNGLTTLKATVPVKYANQNATFEIKRYIRGQVRYYLLGKARTKVSALGSSAEMSFNFKLALKSNDLFRIKVNGIEVIKRRAGTI